jgi:rRNA maturation endonuclease Nob1
LGSNLDGLDTLGTRLNQEGALHVAMGELKDKGVTTSEVLEELAKGKGNLRESLVQLLKGHYSESSEKYVREKVVPRVYSEGQALLKETSRSLLLLGPLQDSLQRYLSLDWNWITAVSCFAAADYAIQKKAGELGIELTETNEHEEIIPKNGKKLLDDIIKKKGGKQTDLKLFNIYNEDYRNDVIHRGKKVEREEAEDISKLTLRLFDSFGSNPPHVSQ